MSSVGASYDAVAERYAQEIGGELDAKPLDRALLAVLAEMAAGGPLADLGCGPGHVGRHLADAGARVLGVDLSVAMCTLGVRGTGLPFAAGDLTRLPLGTGSLAALGLPLRGHPPECGRAGRRLP